MHKVFRRLLNNFIIIFIYACIVSCAQISTKKDYFTSGPSLSFDELVYDFGVAGPKKKISHTFKFKNIGTSTLKIYKLDTSCGCLASLMPKQTIPPEGTGEIRIKFYTRKYEGKQEKVIDVYSNDPKRPKIKLTIKGVIKKDIAIVPSGINFGKVDHDQPVTRQIRVFELSKHPLQVKKIDYNRDIFTIRTARFNGENSKGIEILITLKPKSFVGQLNEVITIHTNLKKRPRIDVPIWAKVI